MKAVEQHVSVVLFVVLYTALCGSRKYPYPPTEGIGISRGVGGGSKAQENPEGGGGCCINLYYFFQTGSIIPIC